MNDAPPHRGASAPGPIGAACARPHIVVLRALGLGDLLTAVPALRGLRRARPEALVSLAAPAWLRPIAPLLGPVVDRLVPTTGPMSLPRTLRGADLAVNLHGRGPQSSAALVASGPRRVLAHAHPAVPATAGGPPWEDECHEVQRWCRLLDHAAIACDPGQLRIDPPADVASPAAGSVVVHLGASAPSRRWPASRWAAVVHALAAAGHRVVLTGAADDRAAAETVRASCGLPASAVLAGRTSLEELCALVASAALVLVGDTGVAHLATAYGTPSVVLFGPVAPAQWGPPPGPHVALWAGRRGDPHGAHTDAGLLLIGPDEVVEAAGRLLCRPPEPRARAG